MSAFWVGFWHVVGGWWMIFQFPIILLIIILLYVLASGAIHTLGTIVKHLAIMVRGWPAAQRPE